jgi:transposase-like protein
VKERGVSIVQAARDLDLNHNVLRRWVKELGADPKYVFPDLGQMKPERVEIDGLRKEVVRLKAEWGACHIARHNGHAHHNTNHPADDGTWLPDRSCD